VSDYRWNLDDFAVGYDASAEHIHPHYVEIQDTILALLDLPTDRTVLVVDAGGGSGRLMERILERWANAIGVVLDQSPPFLALAERRLSKFGERAACVHGRLQDDWLDPLPQQPAAIVSMSAIHHLTPDEKHLLHERVFSALEPGGQFLNGDEVRPAADGDFLRLLHQWSAHMRGGLDRGTVSPVFEQAYQKWADRNIGRFGEPKRSGDDCLQTIDELLADFRSVGFTLADAPWQRDLWAVLRGVKSA
jgi:tRNA (cmo5U34)-methyltransferase